MGYDSALHYSMISYHSWFSLLCGHGELLSPYKLIFRVTKTKGKDIQTFKFVFTYIDHGWWVYSCGEEVVDHCGLLGGMNKEENSRDLPGNVPRMVREIYAYYVKFIGVGHSLNLPSIRKFYIYVRDNEVF